MKTKKGLGPEDIIHKNFAGLMKQYEGYKQLNAVWWSYDASGESRSKTTGGLLKSKGLRPGKSDFEVRTLRGDIMHHIYLEFKAGKNKQQVNQKDFEFTCEGSINNRYYVVYSVEEAVGVLEKEGIINKTR